jgi:hypothetical protein
MPSTRLGLLQAKWFLWQSITTLLNRLSLAWERVGIAIQQKKIHFIIRYWYGRTGNNIQQILIAIAHAETFKGLFVLDKQLLLGGDLDEMFAPIHLDFSPGRKISGDCSRIFFHFTELSFSPHSTKRMHFDPGDPPRLDSLLSSSWVESNLWRVARQYLRPQLLTPGLHRPAEDHLVLCLRSGDIQGLENLYYITNPLIFYKELARCFHSVLIVTEPEPRHLLLTEICALFAESRIEAITYAERNRGFEIIRNARDLATSGVSTFPLSAAILSDRLDSFYCTDMYMDEHLNPSMLAPSIKLHQLHLPGYRRLWRCSQDRPRLLHQYDRLDRLEW